MCKIIVSRGFPYPTPADGGILFRGDIFKGNNYVDRCNECNNVTLHRYKPLQPQRQLTIYGITRWQHYLFIPYSFV